MSPFWPLRSLNSDCSVVGAQSWQKVCVIPSAAGSNANNNVSNYLILLSELIRAALLAFRHIHSPLQEQAPDEAQMDCSALLPHLTDLRAHFLHHSFTPRRVSTLIIFNNSNVFCAL